LAACTVANWSFNFAISFTFLSLVEALGRGGAFWLYAGIAVLALLFWTKVPETKDQSLEEIGQVLGAETDAVESPRGRRRTEPQAT
jgi:hypothetical protein